MNTGTQTHINQEDMLVHDEALLGFALAKVHDPYIAEDLVQDTLLTAISKIGEYKGESSVKTWLFGILRHKILDYFRWLQRHPGEKRTNTSTYKTIKTGSEKFNNASSNSSQQTNFSDGCQSIEKVEDHQNPAKELERLQLRSALKCCIDTLPNSIHQVFMMSEVEEIEPEEICKAAGISRQSLTVFLYRARKELRKCMQAKWLES